MELKDNETLYLLSNFTHQIINPLNGVLGTIDNVIDGTVPEDKTEMRLRSARGQLECTVSLVRNLAFFAEYTADYSNFARGKSDKICVIPQLLIEAAQFFQEQGRTKGISIEVNERHKQYAIHGNPDLLRQIFMNIFDNGVKYALGEAKLEVNYWIKQANQNVIIEIFGRSVGFTEADKIFSLGTRGIAAREKTSSGSGLGLHICKLIVENVFKGKIAAEHSTTTKMTKFTIWLPGGFDNDKRVK